MDTFITFLIWQVDEAEAAEAATAIWAEEEARAVAQDEAAPEGPDPAACQIRKVVVTEGPDPAAEAREKAAAHEGGAQEGHAEEGVAGAGGGEAAAPAGVPGRFREGSGKVQGSGGGEAAAPAAQRRARLRRCGACEACRQPACGSCAACFARAHAASSSLGEATSRMLCLRRCCTVMADALTARRQEWVARVNQEAAPPSAPPRQLVGVLRKKVRSSNCVMTRHLV